MSVLNNPRIRLPYGGGDEVHSVRAGGSDARVLESFLEGLVLRRPTIYLSTPVSTGRWYYEELLRRGARGAIADLPLTLIREVKSNSIRHNADQTLRVFEALQHRFPDANLINPAALQADWSQSQFLTFWVEIIERYVGKMVMSPDWEYSTGASFECMTALRMGIPVEDFDSKSVTAAIGERAVRTAVESLQLQGLVVPELERVSSEFEALSRTAHETEG